MNQSAKVISQGIHETLQVPRKEAWLPVSLLPSQHGSLTTVCTILLNTLLTRYITQIMAWTYGYSAYCQSTVPQSHSTSRTVNLLNLVCQYLNFNSNNLLRVKIGLIQSLHTRASTACQEHQDLCNEIRSLRYNLQLISYLQGFNLLGYQLQGQQACKQRRDTRELCVCPTYKGYFRKVQMYRESIQH
jgi:hypothetical protein